MSTNADPQAQPTATPTTPTTTTSSPTSSTSTRGQTRGLGYTAGAAALSPTTSAAPTVQLSAADTTAAAGQSFHDGDPNGELAGVCPALQGKAKQLIANANAKGLDVKVFQGYRSYAEQDALYAKGRTKPGSIVTNAKGGQSYHNFGVAVDVVFHGKEPWGEKHDWNALGEAGRQAGLEWGGDWAKFKDRPHFQIKDLALGDLQAWYRAGGLSNVWQHVEGGAPAPAPETDTTTPPAGTNAAAAGAATNAKPAAPSSAGSTYTVRSGDTLAGIAGRLLGSATRWGEIAALNHITDPRALGVGTILQIPGAAAAAATSASSSTTTTTTPSTSTAPPPAATNHRVETVTDSVAYVRSGPPHFKNSGRVIPQGTEVELISEVNQNGIVYVELQQHLPPGIVGPPAYYGWTKRSNLSGGQPAPVEPGTTRGNDAAMAPSDPIPLTGLGGLQRQMAQIYNSKGKYLKEKADALGIDVAAAAAVLSVESAGSGFAADGRMTIRFENHVFYDQWGKSNADAFNAHYQYSSAERWKGHKFRADVAGTWESCHQSQSQEWTILDFARGQSDERALRSISMGAGQLMGFNYQTLGYGSARAMFDDMTSGIRPQVDGMFEFIRTKPVCLNGLRERDWVKFAGGYNGSGQAQAYGAKILEALTAYNAVTAGHKHQ